MKKCKYCNKKNIEDDFCSDYCKNKGEKYFKAPLLQMGGDYSLIYYV